MHVGADVFTAWPDRASAKVVFSRSVSRIEVETHSYCNRRCNYCPNVAGDRLGENKRMRAEHWEMILGDLAEISFAGNLVFTSYNEPLADRAILDRIREARRALPRARLLVYSNGDYLDGAYLDELGEAGLHYLHISVHTRYNGRYSEVDALDLIAKLIRRVSRPIRYKRLVANEFILAQIPHPVMEIEVRAINFQRHGIDRAGLVQLERKPQPGPPPAISSLLTFTWVSAVTSFPAAMCAAIRKPMQACGMEISTSSDRSSRHGLAPPAQHGGVN